MRNRQKFNILVVMHFLLTLIFSMIFTSSVWAQNTEVSSAPVVPLAIATLQAKVIQVVLNDEHRQGVDWEAIVSDFHTLQLRKEGVSSSVDKKYTLSVGEVSSEDYDVLLDALDTVGHVIQSDFPPILLTRDTPVSVDISPDPKGFPSIRLELLWFNAPAGDARLKIEPAMGVLLKDSNPSNSMVILKDETEVEFKKDSTIVIGSFISEEEITKTRKFPLLGDLPLVGLVFRKQGRLMQKTETIIFLTMHTNAVPTPLEEKD